MFFPFLVLTAPLLLEYAFITTNIKIKVSKYIKMGLYIKHKGVKVQPFNTPISIMPIKIKLLFPDKFIK